MTMRDAWIHMVDEDAAEGELKDYYDQMRDPATGRVDNILRINGQHPATLKAHYLLSGSPGKRLLTRLDPIVDELAPGIALLSTPGHTSAHTSLVFTSGGFRVVVAGDAVMTHDFFLARDVYFNTVDRAAAVQSIATIADQADIVVPGHDNYFLNRRQSERE